MLEPIYFFNELRINTGFANALHVFVQLRIRRKGTLNLNFIDFPIQLRPSNDSDLATFREVLVKKDYDINPLNSPRYIIDAGANIGLTSVFFANKYPEAQIIAIEPDEDNFRYLQKNAGFYKGVKTLCSAVWSHDAWLKIVDEGRGSDGFVVKEADEADASKFRATSISDIMEQNNWDHIDLLKIDVEGSEKEIFTDGFQEWLPKTKILIVETHDRFRAGCSRALFTAINQYNFTCTLKGLNMVFENQDVLPDEKEN